MRDEKSPVWSVMYRLLCVDCDASNAGKMKTKLESRVTEDRKAVQKR